MDDSHFGPPLPWQKEASSASVVLTGEPHLPERTAAPRPFPICHLPNGGHRRAKTGLSNRTLSSGSPAVPTLTSVFGRVARGLNKIFPRAMSFLSELPRFLLSKAPPHVSTSSSTFPSYRTVSRIRAALRHHPWVDRRSSRTRQKANSRSTHHHPCGAAHSLDPFLPRERLPEV